MDVAVTGSHGLIGTALISSLQADGHRVLCIVRDDPLGPDEVRWDPPSGAIDSEKLDGVDAVVHLAGAGIGDKKWTPARKQLVLDSRTQGTSLLARALAGLTRKPSVLGQSLRLAFAFFPLNIPSYQPILTKLKSALVGCRSRCARLQQGLPKVPQ